MLVAQAAAQAEEAARRATLTPRGAAAAPVSAERLAPAR